METQNIRRKFLDYFKNNGHTLIPSSAVLPHNDPTLLFTNAGMNQFKDVFLGESKRDYTRAATAQKCIRVGGKHNDLDNVGHTRRHLTFFEMLGNFSFGDYFKKEAIRFSWEVATEVFGFDPERIWPTVFESDDEAFELWKAYVPEKRIYRFGASENFWAMGETGPCGPCSELLYDRGARYGTAQNPHEDTSGERYLEFWNLVFMESNKLESGIVSPLPKPSVDTGAGLERIISLKMDVDSVFETDVLRSLIAQTEQVSGHVYDQNNEERASAFRVIADHLRCLAFAIADGVQPSNVDRGYVLRKVLRRAVRYGKTLEMNAPFLARVLPRLIETMGSDYPEIVQSQARIAEILTSEEEAFFRTLRRGGNILNQIIDAAKKHGQKISGEEAFKLKDTYGFPLEEIQLLAHDANLSVDIDRYTALEQEAKERSRKAHKSTKQVAGENLFAEFAAKEGPSTFVGYQESKTDARVLAIVSKDTFVDRLSAGEEGMVVLDKSPFYAEMGGQVGDTGTLDASNMHFTVSDTQSPYKGIIAHIGKMKQGQLAVGSQVSAAIDCSRRQEIANNHTATHLLHFALHKVLGPHVKQAGSIVDNKRLRFDFSHHKALSQEEIDQIEALVNNKIRENKTVDSFEMSYEQAQRQDEIKQFFGDKYDATVRVIAVDFPDDGDSSKELCGGTHTTELGTIGYFRIKKESSIAAGIRRIEAVSGREAEAFAKESDKSLAILAEKLKTQPQKLNERVERLLEENKQLALELKESKKEQMQSAVCALLSQTEEIDGIPLLAKEISVSSKDLRSFADSAMEKMQSGVLILAVSGEGKCQLIAKVSDDLVAKGIKAIAIIKHIAPIVGGSGGGKADTAQAGGKDPSKIVEALAKAREFLAS